MSSLFSVMDPALEPEILPPPEVKSLEGLSSPGKNATLVPKVSFGVKMLRWGAFSHFSGPVPQNTNLELRFKV